jgi:sulfoxide reductase heme-binding subunit YedZ
MTLWLTARGAGLANLVLLTATICAGALAAQIRTPSTRIVVQYVHRASASLGLGVLILHVATIVADAKAHVGVTGAVVPFTANYRASWVGLGTIAAYLILLVATLGFARGRMAASPTGAASWRRVHQVSYAAWPIAIVHGFKSGTDSGVAWVRLLYLACIGAVAVAVFYRSAGKPARAGRLRELVNR